ncbi:hypothetical protein ONE63_003474 [Megalurothrips usitatus]|uniref:MULE transposase domain-containing protein n=1 Tax=Megalurothrips usitatus TaxID=439358 RepID=A0AAV7XB57_9NEOP|nr:hypothetical protein ONE63_003474 [Megalurothrips usitatus]
MSYFAGSFFLDLPFSCRFHYSSEIYWLLLYLLFGGTWAVPVFNVAREAGNRPDSFFYHIGDGLYYHLNNQREIVLCVLSERGCPGRALLDPKTGFIHTQPHEGHDPDPLYADELALRRNIITRCRQLDYKPYRQIIADECRWFEDDVVSRVTYARMRTPMRNARVASLPPLPRNLRELSNILRNPQYSVLSMTDDGRDNIYGGSVTDADGGHHVVFISDRMLAHMRTMRVLHSDGTFRSVPVGPAFADQVFCIICVMQDHIVPLAWVLMESRTQAAYTAVLAYIRYILGDDINLRRVITDFEMAQQNAWQNVFNVMLQGCLWHLCRRFLEHVAEYNLTNAMRNIPEVGRIIRLTFALGLLPPNDILLGFRAILQHARDEGNYIFNQVHPYLMYIWRYYVSRPWMRERMSVFGSAQRTNNVCESHNRTLHQQVHTHPTSQCL